jgi:hypothetical protein
MKQLLIVAATVTAFGLSTSVLAQQQDQQQSQRVVVGKVVAAKDVTLASVAGNGHRLIRLENTNGNTIVVDLGLMEKLPENMTVDEGDVLMVVGKNARINGKPVVYAQYAGELHAVGHTGNQQQ